MLIHVRIIDLLSLNMVGYNNNVSVEKRFLDLMRLIYKFSQPGWQFGHGDNYSVWMGAKGVKYKHYIDEWGHLQDIIPKCLKRMEFRLLWKISAIPFMTFLLLPTWCESHISKVHSSLKHYIGLFTTKKPFLL